VSERIDRKVQEVRVAEFLYRYEAEFAAGFLDDAGIPFWLQVDDAGGAELGMTISRPATLWVRAVDWHDARDVLGLEDEAEAARSGSVDVVAHVGHYERPESRLTALERGVSAGLAVAMFSAVPYVPFGGVGSSVGLLCLAAGVAFLVATAVGRTLGPLERIVRALAGSPPP
jgi:hypothetical protein